MDEWPPSTAIDSHCEELDRAVGIALKWRWTPKPWSAQPGPQQDICLGPIRNVPRPSSVVGRQSSVVTRHYSACCVAWLSCCR